MQQMEVIRVVAEDAHKQHMEALCQLENRTTALVFGLEPRPPIWECSLEDFLNHHPVKFNDKTSLDAAD